MIPWLLLGGLGLLLAFAAWLRWAYRQAPPELQGWLLPALAARLAATAAAAYWPSQDALHANEQGQLIAARLLAHPGQALALLQRPRFYQSLTDTGQEVYRWSQTLFFDKLVALVALLSGNGLWASAVCISIGCFVGCWSLVVAVRRALPQATPPAAVLAFLLWPTVLWWTGGLNKETVLVGAGAGVVALVLPHLYGAPGRVALGWPRWLGQVLLGLLLAWVMTRVRYFFALPLLGGLVALAGVRAATRRHWLGASWLAQVGGLLLALALLLGVARALGGELLTTSYFMREVNLNYHHGLATSGGRPHLAYAHWQPTALGLLAHAPQAVVETLTRPWLGEAAWPQYVGAGLENALLTALVLRALWAAARGRPGPLPVALVAMLLIHCVLLAAFIGLSTPNLGTLNRYRSVLLPWLLWLVLQAPAAPAKQATH
ncbi:hypothetical protein HHL22_02045 [Hymenobacter sp. RP-2-7]|uniref:Uncharacterized protein n=1 Tax=Hymenobacter polaris TaxID=2682546 RepID=A0A7Y0FL42_9BACT|nr:hypothetical protein [Hymenobacter polaris]NML63976.1 hypothetical protein [Hymenobacter polaris]